MLDHYHYRRWYRTTTRTDLCCFHLQLNQYLTAFLQRHKHKERTASGGIYGQRLRSHMRPQTPVTYEQDNCRADLPTEYDPVAGIVLPPERPCRWYRTTTYTDNDRADMHAIH